VAVAVVAAEMMMERQDDIAADEAHDLHDANPILDPTAVRPNLVIGHREFGI
jgi:hypothetical protein